MSNQCPLCDRPKKNGSEYCVFHFVALVNLDNAYLVWKKAFGDIPRAEYFAKVEALPETGLAAKNLVHHLREKGAVA